MVGVARPKRWILRRHLQLDLFYYEQTVFPEEGVNLAAAHEYWWADELAEEQAMKKATRGKYVKVPKNGGRYMFCCGDDTFNVLFSLFLFFFLFHKIQQ